MVYSCGFFSSCASNNLGTLTTIVVSSFWLISSENFLRRHLSVFPSDEGEFILGRSPRRLGWCGCCYLGVDAGLLKGKKSEEMKKQIYRVPKNQFLEFQLISRTCIHLETRWEVRSNCKAPVLHVESVYRKVLHLLFRGLS